MEPSQNTISLKMIPRIDLDRIKAKMSLVTENRLTKNTDENSCDRVLEVIYSVSVCACRKTGLLRGRSLRDQLRGCLMLRKSGEHTFNPPTSKTSAEMFLV